MIHLNISGKNLKLTIGTLRLLRGKTLKPILIKQKQGLSEIQQSKTRIGLQTYTSLSLPTKVRKRKRKVRKRRNDKGLQTE